MVLFVECDEDVVDVVVEIEGFYCGVFGVNDFGVVGCGEFEVDWVVIVSC